MYHSEHKVSKNPLNEMPGDAIVFQIWISNIVQDVCYYSLCIWQESCYIVVVISFARSLIMPES